ncbi:hypothetical protein K439DRAFT_980474 [Ramaria rubella]|nr:hypothetical protein K439DRAFT_980474 [Ramaria rubella]
MVSLSCGSINHWFIRIIQLAQPRVFYVQRKYQPALKLFQDVLKLNSKCVLDPHIGIGLYLWALGNRETAKAAWKRGLDLASCLPSSMLLPLTLNDRFLMKGRHSYF